MTRSRSQKAVSEKAVLQRVVNDRSQVGAPSLFELMISSTGLPEQLVHEDLEVFLNQAYDRANNDQICQNKAYRDPDELTMEQLRQVLAAYLEATNEFMTSSDPPSNSSKN